MPPLTNLAYISIPVVAAIAGWLTALWLRSTLISRTTASLPGLAGSILPSLVSKPLLQKQMAEGCQFEQIRPLVEIHIDDFLQHKLGKEMPMIGMFIGEKTIAQLKTIFMKELEEIFPKVMQQYAANLLSSFDPQTFLSQKIASLPQAQLKSTISRAIGRQLHLLPVAGLAAGLLTGLIQLLVIWCTS